MNALAPRLAATRPRQRAQDAPTLPRSWRRRCSRVTSTPPCRSASVTTPSRQRRPRPSITGCGGPRRVGGRRPSRTSSEDPPPMSNRITPCGVRDRAAACSRLRRDRLGLPVDDFEFEPDLLGDRARRIPAPLAAAAAGLGRDQSRAGHAASCHLVAADRERLDSARDRRLADAAGAETPSPNRTMREKASTTRKPSPVGRATSSRQLLVPRSSAA